MLTRRLLCVLASASLLSLVGCREAKIASYKVKREATPPPSVAALTAGLPQLKWKSPTDWKEQPAGNVRIASFLITADAGRKADMSITQFPGDVGGDLANINRWRTQLQLPPISEAELAKIVTVLDLPLGKFQLTDMSSAAPVLEGNHHARILGAWLKQPDRTWFFKLAGEADLVGTQRDAFASFLRSLEFGPAEAPPAPAPEMTMGALPSPMNNAGSRPLAWAAPTDWTSKAPGPMRKGSFTLHGANGGDADLSIISFPGDAGGVAENLNRWRGQVQLPPLSPTELASSAHTLANSGLRFTVVDYAGTTATGPTRLLGAVLPLENETYFFKLMGPDEVVVQHRTAFMDFLKTVKTR